MVARRTAAALPLPVDLGRRGEQQFLRSLDLEGRTVPGRTTGDHNNVIARREVVLKQAKRLANEAFDAVAFDCGADSSIHAQAEAGESDVVRPSVHDQRMGRLGALGVEHRSKLEGMLQTLLRAKAKPPKRFCG